MKIKEMIYVVCFTIKVGEKDYTYPAWAFPTKENAEECVNGLTPDENKKVTIEIIPLYDNFIPSI